MLKLDVYNDEIVIKGYYEEDYLIIDENMNDNSEIIKDYRLVSCDGFTSPMSMVDLIEVLGSIE